MTGQAARLGGIRIALQISSMQNQSTADYAGVIIGDIISVIEWCLSQSVIRAKASASRNTRSSPQYHGPERRQYTDSLKWAVRTMLCEAENHIE